MAERTTITQVCQIGVEVTPGAGGPANKKLQSISIDLSPNVETRAFRAAGNKFPSLVIPGKEWAIAKLVGEATYTEIVYVLASVLGYAAPAQQGGTSAYKWTHSPSTSAPDTVKTLVAEQGSSVRAHRTTNLLITALQLAFSRDGITISGDGIGKALEDGVVMTGGASALDLVPVLPTQVDIYLADTVAGLDMADPLERAISASFAIGNRFGAIYPLATANGTGFAATIETEPTLEYKLKVEADAEGMALLANLRQGTTKFMRIQAVGDTIEDAETYMLTIDAAVKVSGVSEFSDEDGLYAIEWTLTGVHDPVWGKSLQVEVVNELAAL
jgi:hypothetical protein